MAASMTSGKLSQNDLQRMTDFSSVQYQSKEVNRWTQQCSDG